MELSFNKIIIEAYKNADITMVIYNQGAFRKTWRRPLMVRQP